MVFVSNTNSGTEWFSLRHRVPTWVERNAGIVEHPDRVRAPPAPKGIVLLTLSKSGARNRRRRLAKRRGFSQTPADAGEVALPPQRAKSRMVVAAPGVRDYYNEKNVV